MTKRFQNLQRQDIRQVETRAGQSLVGIASQYLNDPSRFRDIADLNGGLNPLEILQGGTVLQVPLREALNRAQPVFTQMQEIVNQGTQFISRVEGAAQQLGIQIPEGYTHLAQDAIGQINGVLGQVETVLDDAQQNTATGYGGRARIIDWLLQ